MGAVYDDFARELDAWSRKYAGKPSGEMLRLLFLSLEREELVSINYREDLILQRLQTMPVAPEVRKLIHHALVWSWKDEQMHTIYLRGAILQLGNFPLRTRAFARQMIGATGGWIEVDGINTPLPSWRGPYQNEWTSLLSLFALPVYEYASGRGALFVPEMDTVAFPPLQPESRRLRLGRRGIQAFLGLRRRS